MNSKQNASDDEESLGDSAEMDIFTSEGIYLCDACGEEIVVPLEPDGQVDQHYVEDCPVCCHPNVIHVHWHGSEAQVRAEPEQDRY